MLEPAMDYFERYLQVAPFSHALWRSQEAKYISRINTRRPILDVGCGFGEFAGVFFDQSVEMGVDVNKQDLIQAAGRARYSKLILSDARHLPFENNTFHTVLAVSTLEHIRSAHQVMTEIYRVLKKGGTLIFSVPTSEIKSHFTVARFFRYLGLSFLEDAYVNGFHKAFKHETVLSNDEWLMMVKDAGFTLVSCEGTISKRQLRWYEFGLPFALPTQLFRTLLGKRLPFSPAIRISFLVWLFQSILDDTSMTNANVLIIGRKS